MTEESRQSQLFLHLVLTFQSAAWQQMGKIKNPITDQIEAVQQRVQEIPGRIVTAPQRRCQVNARIDHPVVDLRTIVVHGDEQLSTVKGEKVETGLLHVDFEKPGTEGCDVMVSDQLKPGQLELRGDQNELEKLLEIGHVNGITGVSREVR